MRPAGGTDRARTFGRFLLERGFLSREQLEEATQVMVVFGGRLGTILVESGVITLAQLEEHLSRHLGLPGAPPDRLARPDPQALAAVGSDLARRHHALPMWIEKRRLHAAMLDPASPERVDALAFATGLSIAPYVVAERRLVELLERHYGVRPDSRFTDPRVLELAGHARAKRPRNAGAREAVAPRPADGEDEERMRWREEHGLRPLAQGEELSDADSYAALHAERAPEPLPAAPPRRGAPATASAQARAASTVVPAPSAAEAAQSEAQLVMLADPDAVVPTALRAAAHHARIAALFAVRDGMIQGILAAGEAAAERIDGIFVPASEPSMLSDAARGRVFRGPPRREGIDAAVVRVIGGCEPREAAVLPITVRGRVVQLLYVDNGSEPLPSASLAALGSLCDAISSAYARLIAESTRRHC